VKFLFIDGSAGASGDMLLAALLDLTGGRKALEEGPARLGLAGVRLLYPPRRRGGVEATGVEVVVSGEAPHFDDVRAVERLLDRAELSPFVRNGATQAFRKLAEAEQRAHRVAVGHAGFHEVGAADAVVDVVGTFILLELARAERVVVSPLRLGSGYVEAAHGTLPVPAPATLELLRGVPAFAGDVPGEFTTPTGAALIASIADEFGAMPTMTVERVGYGPGAADPAGVPNVLRAFAGEGAAPDETRTEGRVVVLEANVDDMTAEELSFAARALFDAGALDVAVMPAVMKKGRPGHIVKIIGRPEDRGRLCDLTLRYTSTLGVRSYDARRKTLERRVVTVESEYGTGKVKLAVGPGGEVFAHAEYDSAAELAARAAVGVREVARSLEAAALEKETPRPNKKGAGPNRPRQDKP
jgi:uncharacterized protein (TIGR00299 family) protein